MGTFNTNRLKVQLKLAVNRLKMLQAKKSSLNEQARREIAALLEKGKEESARIRVRICVILRRQGASARTYACLQ
jgi:hypothetical protein